MGKIDEKRNPADNVDPKTARSTSPVPKGESPKMDALDKDNSLKTQTTRTTSKEKTERNDSERTKSPITAEKESPRKPKKSAEKGSPQRVGFPAKVPKKFLSDVSLKACFDAPEARSGLVVSQAMLVLQVDEHSVFSGKVSVCDYIFSINDKEITSKSEFSEIIRTLKKSAETFTMKLKRPIWNVKTERLPKGYDCVPGYDYFLGLMILYPGGKLGMNVKSYNSKVYVTHTDQSSLSTSTCIVGDSIVEVNGTPVTCTAVCSNIILKTLKEKKHVVMTLERAVSQRALNFVRFVLLTEKTQQLDPRMADDSTNIGCSQALRIQNVLVPPAPKGIYRTKNRKPHTKRITIRDMTLLTSIATEPYNPLLMQAVPPKKMDALIEKVRNSRESLTSGRDTKGLSAFQRATQSASKTKQLGNFLNW